MAKELATPRAQIVPTLKQLRLKLTSQQELSQLSNSKQTHRPQTHTEKKNYLKISRPGGWLPLIITSVMVISPASHRTQPFKHQPQKMVKPSQTIRREEPMDCLSVFDHFLGSALKRLRGERDDPLMNDLPYWLKFRWLLISPIKKFRRLKVTNFF